MNKGWNEEWGWQTTSEDQLLWSAHTLCDWTNKGRGHGVPGENVSPTGGPTPNTVSYLKHCVLPHTLCPTPHTVSYLKTLCPTSNIVSYLKHCVLPHTLCPTVNTVSYPKHCVLPQTLCPTSNSVSYPKHCVLPHTLCPTPNTVSYLKHCVLPQTLCPTVNTVSYLKHCVLPQTLCPTTNTVSYHKHCVLPQTHNADTVLLLFRIRWVKYRKIPTKVSQKLRWLADHYYTQRIAENKLSKFVFSCLCGARHNVYFSYTTESPIVSSMLKNEA